MSLDRRGLPVLVQPASKLTHPSNGALTAVKTCQQLSTKSASSSSAPSQEPVPCSWEITGDDQLSNRAPTAEQLYNLKSLPVAMVRGKSKTKKHKDMNVTIGNDSKVPWLKSMSNNSVIHITSMLAPQSMLVTSTTVPTFSALAFLVNSMDNFASLASVYDQYYITLIEILIYPQFTETTPGGSNATGNWCSAVDLDDATAPTTYAQLAAYTSAQSGTGTASHYHRFAPQFAVAAYSGTFTSYSSSVGWIDCASPTVQHYGIKMANDGTGGAAQTFYATIKYHVMFRAVH